MILAETPAWAVLIPTLGVVVAPILTYLITSNKQSGRVKSTEASTLWAEAENMRKGYRDEAIQLRLEAASLRAEVLALREEVLSLRAETLTLKVAAIQCREELSNLKGEEKDNSITKAVSMELDKSKAALEKTRMAEEKARLARVVNDIKTNPDKDPL